MAGDQAGKDLLAIDDRLFAAKENIDSLHQEIADFFYPERADFTREIQIGEEFATHLTDFYPTLVRRELGDQIGSMTRPNDRPWFKASVGIKEVERDQAASEFLEFMTDVNRSILYSRDSGFRRGAKEADHDWASFGMACEQVRYSRDRSNLLFKTHHLKDCAFSEGHDGQIDHVHRKCDMTARSMAYWFGEDKLPEVAKRALEEKKHDQKFKVRHIFIPLDKYEPTRKFPSWAKWADVYVTTDGKILSEQPSATFDYVISRWATLSGKVYAFSPATVIALPQARMLQRMMMTLIEAGEKRVDPPIMAVEDAILSPIDLSSGAITYLDTEHGGIRDMFMPIDLGKDVGLGVDLIADSRQQLADAFYLNKLMPLANRDKEVTAYEASQLVQEYIRSALPLFEPLEDERSGRMLDLVTQKVMRAGGYGPVDRNGIPEQLPDALLGSNIQYEFSNSLTEARERQMIQGYQESLSITAMAAQLDPASVAEINIRDMFRDAFGAVPGGRADWRNSDEEAMQGRAQMQQQQQAQQMMDQVGQGAAVAESVGKAGQALQGVG